MLTQPGPPRSGARAPRPSKLDPFKPHIEQRLSAGIWNTQVLLRELRAQGYTGGYPILKDYLHPKRRAAREVAVRRFETPPGRQGQVDWGHLAVLEEAAGRRHALSALPFTLSHSRVMHADVATDRTLETFLRLQPKTKSEQPSDSLSTKPGQLHYWHDPGRL